MGKSLVISVQHSQTSSGKNRGVFSSHQWMQQREILAHFYSNLLLGLCETFQLGIWLHLLLGSRNAQFVRNCVSEHVLMGNFSQVLGTLSFWGCNGSLAADGIFSKCWSESWPEAGRESGHSFGQVQLGTFSFPNCWSLARDFVFHTTNRPEQCH